MCLDEAECDTPGTEQVLVESMPKPLKGSTGPAAKAGVKVSDIVLSVDDTSVVGKPLADVLAALRRGAQSKQKMLVIAFRRPDKAMTTKAQAVKERTGRQQAAAIERLGRAALKVQVAWRRKKGTLGRHICAQALARISGGEDEGEDFHGKRLQESYMSALPQGSKKTLKIAKDRGALCICLDAADSARPGVHQIMVESLAKNEKGRAGPAEAAGVKVGDLILSVDGKSVVGTPLSTVLDALREASRAKSKKLALLVLRPAVAMVTQTEAATRREESSSLRYVEQLGAAALRVQLAWRRRKGTMAQHIIRQAQTRIRAGSSAEEHIHAQQMQRAAHESFPPGKEMRVSISVGLTGGVGLTLDETHGNAHYAVVDSMPFLNGKPGPAQKSGKRVCHAMWRRTQLKASSDHV